MVLQIHVAYAEDPKTSVVMLLVLMVSALSPWFMFAATRGVDLILLMELWFDVLAALLAALQVVVLCICPCQLGMN